MKRIITILALTCAVAFQVNAQNTVEENKKMVSTNLQIAEQTVKLADANPTDGQKQYAAAGALIGIAVNTDGQYERAIAYAHKALEIAQAHKERKDTLLANTYSLLSNIYMMQGSVDNACDFMELSVDATEEQLGRYDPVTIYNRLKTGLTLISIYPDTRRGFLNVMQAFYDNDKAPANKRIKNMDQLNIQFSMAMEQMLTAYANGNRYAVPVLMMDGEKYYLVQTRDWHIGQPLANWLSPNMLRSEDDRLTHRGENIILMNDKGEFRCLSKEEGQRLSMVFPQFMLNPNSREVELITPSASYLWYLQPQVYNDTVKRFEEFINKK
ncbi:MAG: tetratricopeptide repeat protein [Prevotella sp.]|nr:tetratricopeptide repeat protein [Prevotella sp.]